MKKLAIIVPYRDRQEQLDRFITHIDQFFQDKDIEYDVLVVEQDNDKPFNRGKLLNVGFLELYENYDYFCFHDVDMLPEDADYSYVNKPTHMAVEVENNEWELLYPDYFGGVTLFPTDQFFQVNGYSNEYWGWGFEDDDLLIRCKNSSLPLDVIAFGEEHKRISHFLDFDGETDYVEIPTTNKRLRNIFAGDFTISTRAIPISPSIDPVSKYDQFGIVSRPGFHNVINYTSGKSFKYDLWTDNYKLHTVTSDMRGEYLAHLVVTYSYAEQLVTFYIDGEAVGSFTFDDKIISYGDSPFYLGVSDPLSSTYKQFFSGRIYEVAIWDAFLEAEAIKQLSSWDYLSLTRNKGKYKKSKNLLVYYDFEHVNNDVVVDLSGNGNNGYRVGAQRREEKRTISGKITVPYRRNGRFRTLNHENAGWDHQKNFWVHNETRKNQLRFFNESKPDMVNYKFDGLNSCEYTKTKEKDLANKVKKISVDI